MTNLFKKAEAFVRTCYQELGMEDKIEERLMTIKQDIQETNFYEHTFTELEHGAKMAWRNANKCIGRLFWHTLTVRDARLCTDEEAVFNELTTHLRLATNGGKIKPMMTFFAPRKHGEEPARILNHQLVRYAGYEAGPHIIGDPASQSFTALCESLGWRGEGSAFDVLPLVIKLGDGSVRWRDLPEDEVLRVPISHPDTAKLNDLQLEWYAVPAITDMMVEIGGIEYPTVPFNGWYMGTEIGARNFADEKRYNLLPIVAEKLEFDMTKASSLWKDKALVELNRAVLHSFQKKGVSIVDHHTAAEQFKQFEKREKASGRPLTGTWSWLIPPLSPATTHIFHQDYKDELVSPNFHYQEPLFQENGSLK
ncbi:nitric oxide synthase oxygenase [Salipaludibacillus agaradhaerens]|uniref:nitric oxide synthase oxygenase n=1 Tax=Salipaludibacillus agaradhaerens TaxID=76935 RepID=UPI002151012E|nr:nitric oxide synthase oxygenase [Salipaludibacillus agaradhaerens]MCR6105783.1 nitric oxide synthase oxygenase [Salipaludibacillus agaradhaerens]MCR6117819.1 nitric oxide synthase oxygenase [Salipaludibacillus agaradhaerens]